jgi:hypothetical protein
VAERVPESFVRVLEDLGAWLDDAGIAAMVVGGVAASVLGRPRATGDIDTLAILPEEKWADAVASARWHGFGPRVDEPLAFARRMHVLLLRHEGSGIDVDVILGRLPFEEEAVARGRFHDLGGVRTRLPQVEDLLIMKAVAQRPRDLRDIEGLLDAHPGADLERVRATVREFAAALAMPDLLDGLERVLDRHRSRRPR